MPFFSCQEPIGQTDFLKQTFNFNKNLITFKEMSTSNRFFSALRLNNIYFHYQKKADYCFCWELENIFDLSNLLDSEFSMAWTATGLYLILGKIIFVKLNVLTCMLSNFILYIIFWFLENFTSFTPIPLFSQSLYICPSPLPFLPPQKL